MVEFQEGAFAAPPVVSANECAASAVSNECTSLHLGRDVPRVVRFTAAGTGPAGHGELLPDVPEWSDSEKLKNEKEALDFYFSSHPLAQHEAELRRFASHSVEQLAKLEANQEVLLAGMLNQVRFLEFGLVTPQELSERRVREYARALDEPDLYEQFLQRFES